MSPERIAELRISIGKSGAARFEVRVKPRARRSAIDSVRAGALVVAVAAPPVDGAANSELVDVLSRVLGVPKSAITIARGASSKTKLVEIARLSESEIRARLT